MSKARVYGGLKPYRAPEQGKSARSKAVREFRHTMESKIPTQIREAAPELEREMDNLEAALLGKQNPNWMQQINDSFRNR